MITDYKEWAKDQEAAFEVWGKRFPCTSLYPPTYDLYVITLVDKVYNLRRFLFTGEHDDILAIL